MNAQPLRRDRSSNAVTLKFVPAQVLIEREKRIRDLIAYRAYEIFERRGRGHGSDASDWLLAESEMLFPCRHELKELPDRLIVKAEMPGGFTSDELKVSVEPHRLMVSGERKIDAIYGDEHGGHLQAMPERIFRVHDLRVEIDSSRATATLRGETLEIIMPKAAARDSVMSEWRLVFEGGPKFERADVSTS